MTEVVAELQQRWRRTNRRRKSIPRSSSSHREGSIAQHASCGRYDQRQRRSTPKTSTVVKTLNETSKPIAYAMAWLTRMQRNQGNARYRSEPRPCLVRSPCLNSRLNNSHPSPGWSPGPHPAFGPDRGQGQSQGQLTRLKLVRDARAQDSPRMERGALYSLLATANLLFFLFSTFCFFWLVPCGRLWRLMSAFEVSSAR